MSQSLVPFNFDDNLVRSLMIDDSPWFVATDIAKILDYRNAPDMVRMLDPDEAATHNVRSRSENGVEQDRQVTIISQSGLYHAILKSRKPEARRFRRWVTGELLPELHRTGSYALANQSERLRLEAERQRLKTREAALQMLDRITTERSHPVREALYPILEQDFQALGVKAPPLEAIGTALPASSALLDDFWEILDHLEARSAAVNHAADPKRLSINLPHLAEVATTHEVELPSSTRPATRRRSIRPMASTSACLTTRIPTRSRRPRSRRSSLHRPSATRS